MDGCEATRRLRLHEMESGLTGAEKQKIIGISANADSDIEKSAISSGMDCFIPVMSLPLNVCIMAVSCQLAICTFL